MAQGDPDRDHTGNPAVDAAIANLVDLLGAGGSRRANELLVAAAGIVGDEADPLDLKIAAAALQEMRRAYATFKPYRSAKKVTVFGSARTRPDDANYALAYEVAQGLAQDGWMIVTGAGPGIMIAANQGAGRDMSFGVNIRLPFETEVHALLHGDHKLVDMKYFFTRKLMLVKESSGFVALPGGFGTLDETFELLTLQQTGKADPAPIVLLDAPGGTYWTDWAQFVERELIANGMVSATDRDLFTVTDNVETACRSINGFWANYHSIRYVGDHLVVRMQRDVSDDGLADINERFAHLVDHGAIERTRPLRHEVDDDDVVDLPRLTFAYGNRHYGKLNPLIHAINKF